MRSKRTFRSSVPSLSARPQPNHSCFDHSAPLLRSDGATCATDFLARLRFIRGEQPMSYARGYESFDPYGGLTEDEELTADGPYWLRHWRGQLPLGRSYWVNGFIVNITI